MKSIQKIMFRAFLILSLLFFGRIAFSQVSITTSTTYTENFNSFTGPVAGTAVSTLNSPTNWTLTATGNTWRGTAQTTGASGGWYSNSNLSFLGSGTASNAQSTWILQNNSGNNITGFTLQFTGRLWKTGTSSPSVSVSWVNSSLSTNPTAGALTNSLSSCTFNDATTNISTGATLSQNVSGLSIANGQYIFIRFIHAGGSNSDNLGWDDISFTPTIASSATISSTGTLSAVSTTYGTASSTTSFSVSGTSMSAGITITPPSGFEVSTSSTFSSGIGTSLSPIVVGSSGTISSTTIYVRLSSSASVGTTIYNNKNIVLSSAGATSVNVPTALSGNSVSTKSLTISGATAQNKSYDGTTTATITGTLSGVVGSDVVNLILSGTFASANVGTSISVTSTSTISGASASNYTLTQPTGLTANITKANQTITFNTIPYKIVSDPDFSPASTNAVGLSVTYSSSNTSVATIVGGQIHIVGTGSSIISANQSGDANYNAASQVQQTLYVNDLIARWNFESVTTTNTGTTPSFGSSSQLADTGIYLSATLITAYHSNSSTIWSNPSGNGSTKSISSNFWSVGDYFQFKFATIMYDNIKLVFEQTGSNTGPKDFKIQYSLDGITFTDITTYVVPYNTTSNTSYGWSTTTIKQESILSFDLSSITDLIDKSDVYIRLVNTSTNAINGSTVGTGGTSRVDNFKILGTYNVTLPVELLSFKGVVNNGKITLEWETATETNNDYFTIYKSKDGINWDNIGIVNGSGFSNHIISYQLIDNNPFMGINYYRLSQTDFDGTTKINDMIGVLFEGESKMYFNLNENPISDKLKFDIGYSYPTTLDVNIINHTGVSIYSQILNVNKGVNSYEINNNLSSGVYFIYLVENGDLREVRKFVKK